MPQPRLLGQFRIGENLFEYSNRPDNDRGGIWPDYPQRVFTLDGDRAAIIKKTVAYVVIGEDETGGPITEKWPLQSHRAYA